MYYFDWAATSLQDTEIIEKAFALSQKYCGNPSSVHALGIEAKNIIQQARKSASQALGVPENTIYFTSGGTESDYLPILSLLQRPNKGSILISNIEHSAIKEQAEAMKNCGWKIITVNPNSRGIIEPQAIIEKLEDDTALVCVMAVNNETGAIQPIYDIADALIHFAGNKKKPKFHVDAVQAVGKIPLNLAHKGIDSAAISGHKIGGPRGIGILYLQQRQEPFLRGGGQEKGIRSGTENLYGICAIADCLQKYAITSPENTYFQNTKNLSAYFIEELQKIVGCTLIPNTRQKDDQDFSPFVIQAAFDNVPGEVMVRALSEKGIYISTGSACSARKLSRPILEAMKVPQKIASEAVRFSFGHTTTKEAIDFLLNNLKNIVQLFN